MEEKRIKINLIDQLYQLLDQEGLQLAPGLTLNNDHRPNYIIVCNEDAVTSDEYEIFTSYSVQKTFEWLQHEHLTEII